MYKDFNNIITPRQPFFAIASSSYKKMVVMDYGISHFYCYKKHSDIEHIFRAVPDGAIDILFCCDERKFFANIYGTVLNASDVNYENELYYFGVRFQPGRFRYNKKMKPVDLVGKEIQLINIFCNNELIEKIILSRDFNYQIKVFMKFYLNYYYNNKSLSGEKDLNRYLINRIIQTGGKIKVSELSQESNYSIRYINKVVNEEIGVSPKIFSKIIRFQNLLSNLNKKCTKIDLADIAINLGYYDQSHMIKDFQQYAKSTPIKYISTLDKVKYDKKILINYLKT